ncbi:MAG: rhodanese-like domain-containing protein [Acetobacteraceae bacterium]
MKPRSRLPLLLLLALAAAAPAGTPVAAHAPEPRGYWLGPVHGPVPASIAGGTVIGTPALARLVRQGGIVLVDVAEATRRPSGLPPGTLWVPVPHRDIPGSVWIPDAGRGVIRPELAAYFRAQLATLTGGDRGRLVVIYCHPHCWMSWNAAKRAISYGYRRIAWYPGGMEAWRKAGYPTTIAPPEGPDAR